MSLKNIITYNNVQLELDSNRGVLYAHGRDGKTLLRVCRIPDNLIKLMIETGFLDITLGVTAGKSNLHWHKDKRNWDDTKDR